ncbi:hypothetical protein ACHAXR_005192 [Thalassiosira sp. AJA248-18]
MAPIAAAINKQSRDQRLGIGMINSIPGAPVTISSIANDGLFAACALTVGMQVLSINNIPIHADMTSGEAIQILKDAEGQIVVVADNPIQAAVIASVPVQPTTAPSGKKRGYIILKKTFKVKPGGFQIATEKSYSFHGPMTPDMVNYVNEQLRGLRLTNEANMLQFNMNQFGHFYGRMNHAAQKYHEEDFVVIMLEAMEELGYYFRFQYDAEASSTKITGDSYTAKELFIFHKTVQG